MPLPSEKILWDVMEEHLEEAGFLWSQWEAAQGAPDYTLAELAGREEARLVAHLDALVLGGAAVAEELLLPALESDQQEQVLAAALALQAGEHGGAVLEALGQAQQPGTISGLRRALELSPAAAQEAGLRQLLLQGSPTVAATALRVLSFHGLPCELPAVLLAEPDPQVRCAVLEATCINPTLPPGLAEAALDAEQPSVRDAALVAGLYHGQDEAHTRYRKLAAQDLEGCRVPLRLAAQLGGEAGLETLRRALDDPQRVNHALWALGFAGSVEAAEAAVAVMLRHPELAPAAAESLCMITGLDLLQQQLLRPPPSAEDEDERGDDAAGLTLQMAPEAHLPQPAVEGVSTWWEQNRGRLEPDRRYLLGQQMSLSALGAAMQRAPLWRRHGLAQELLIRSGPHSPLRLQTRTWCLLQRSAAQQLSQLAEHHPELQWGAI